MSDSAINHFYIQNYSKEFAGMVCRDFFRNKSTVQGKEILEFTGIRQVNLFIVRFIYDAWQKESDRLRGSYFDYSSPELNEALNNLRNVMSNHIKVEKAHFEPLVANAVEKTLLLIFSPYELFLSQFSSLEPRPVSLSSLKGDRKFIKINTHLYDAFLAKLEEKKIPEASKENLVDIFNEVCEKFSESPDDPDPYVTLFTQTVLLDVGQVYLEKETGAAKPVVKTRKREPLAQAVDVKDNGERKTLLDEYQENKSDTIADFLKRKTIESIRKSITINQKFMFVRECSRMVRSASMGTRLSATRISRRKLSSSLTSDSCP